MPIDRNAHVPVRDRRQFQRLNKSLDDLSGAIGGESGQLVTLRDANLVDSQVIQNTTVETIFNLSVTIPGNTFAAGWKSVV